MTCYFLALSLSVLYSLQPANGVSLELNATIIPNFGLLGHSEVDTSDNNSTSDNLVCRTDNTSCCRGSDNPARMIGFGNWFYPNGTRVVFPFTLTLPDGVIYRQRRLQKAILLYREFDSNTTANGIYRCEVADENGINQTRYVGLYTEGAGVVSIFEDPQFSLISEDPVEFTLTSTTTGGPPTTAFWTLPNTATPSGDQELLNGVTATVRHTQTVTGRLSGVYMFTTTNARSSPPDTSSITVQAANPSIGLTAVQASVTSILVSWTAPAPGGVNVTGYRISYQTGGGSEQNVTVGATATSHTLRGLQSGATYSISIVARSNQLPSARVGPETVVVKIFESPTVTKVPSPTSIRVTFTQPSGSLAAESYDIQYARVTGAGQTLCDSVEDTGATTDVQSPFTITKLEEFSSYNITVTARAFSAMRTTTEQAMTSPAAPSGPPKSVMTSPVTSSSITVQWGRVSCIDRNSEITGYIVRYGQTGSTTTVMESVSETSNSDRMFAASGLLPCTSYTFEVAAVSSEGTGPFSNATTADTAVPEGIALQLNGQCYANNSLVTLTDIGEGDTAALLCLTDRVECCRAGDGGAGGDWYFPDGDMVPAGAGSGSIYRTRKASRVQLNRRNDAQSPTGVYRCEVPDASGTNQSIYVGVVTNANGAGSPTISTIQFELTSATDAATPSFTLDCITVGGPVDFNDITWTRVGSSLPANHGLFQVLDDGSTTTYNNTLAVTGRETGQYTCRLQPPGGNLTTRNINVEAANPPTGLTAVQNSLASILVFWNTSAPGIVQHTGYRISYQTGAGSVQSTDVGPTATSHTLTGLQSGATYSISIEARSNQLPSTVVGPETVIIEAATTPPPPPVTTSAPSPSPTTPPPPAVTVSLGITTSGTGVAGDTYSLTCTATVMGTEIAPMFEWLDRDSMMISNTDGVTITNSGRSSVLTLMSLSFVYDGSITCLATVGTVTEMNSTSVTVQNVGVSLDINGNLVDNYGLLAHNDIDTSNDIGDVGGNLVCRTDNTTCCRGADGLAQGKWYYPTGDEVMFPFAGPLPIGQIYRPRRDTQVVRLYREGAAITATANGIYRCEVADQNGVTQTRYVGLYTEGAGAGVVSISQDPTFSLISEDHPLEFTLTSTTTGGPPTTAEWTLPNTAMATGDQTLLNGSTATVQHTLTVTEKMLGVYMFSTTNARSGPSITRSITVQATNPPTGLMAVQDSPTSILVSWTAPASGGASRTGYHIFYQNGGSSVQTVPVEAGATSHTLTGLQSGAIYSISIVTLSNTFPSTVVGPVTVTIEERDAPTVMTSVLGPTSIRVTFSASNAESYDIQYTRVVGPDQQLCPDNVDTMTDSGVTSPYDITNLEEFSSYDITVTAIFPGPTMIPTTVQNTTTAAAPAAAPQNLIMMSTTIVLSTSITVGWDPVECIKRNGVIDNYIVRFGPVGGPGVQNEQTVGTTRTHTASGLTPSTRYSFSVAAVNSAGTGPFTATPLIVETIALRPPTGLVAVQDGLTSVLVSWTAPASDSSVITGYLITYTRTGGSGPQSVTVERTATSHTLTSLERGAIYSITIVSLSGTSSSSVEGPVMVTVRDFFAPTVSTSVLGPTSIRVTFTQPSGLPAESYDIQSSRVMGIDQQLCPDRNIPDDNVTLSGNTSLYDITNLQEFSSYDITVTAIFPGQTMIPAATVRNTTSTAAPAAAPRDLVNTTVLSTSITVGWNPVECIERNGVIDNYIVRFGSEGGVQNESTVQSGGIDVAGTYNASGLIPRNKYTFNVAAANSNGNGPFMISNTTVETLLSEGVSFHLNGQRYGNNSLVPLTAIGEGDTAALLCLTDQEMCCRSSDGNGFLGEWYFPNGTVVLDGFNSNNTIFRNRGASRVRLNRRYNAQSPTGVYRCEVPDRNGTNQSIYVGVYQQSSGNLTSAAIAYNGTSNTLVCTSTGGPATTVTWRKDNVVLDKSVRIFQIITNTTEATYDNVLQLNDNGNLDGIIGNYSCDVSNVKSTQVAVYTIQGLQISGHEATLQLGESYTITCTTDLEVATIEWLDSATMKVIENGNSSPVILELEDVDSTLNGANYTCRTTSPHGMQERRITLTVELKSPTSDSPIGATVGAIVAIGLVLLLLLLLAVVLWCIIYRKKRRGKFTLFDRVRSKRGRKSQSYGVPYDVRGSGIDGAMELKGVGEEEEEGKDDDYFEDTAALAMDRKRPIPLSEFGTHVQRMHNDREKKFELEFDSLIKHPQSSVDIAQIPVNRDRNRFGNIFPYNINRVMLNEIPGVKGSDYINASYIEGYNNTENAYIAAQGPLPNSIDDFWRMIWEQKLCTVVMLTKCFEGKAKCEKYWPENLESTLKLKNNLVISMTEVLPFTEYEIRKLKVQDTSKPSEPPLAVTQLHYTIWPDHGAPGNAMSVINFIKRVRRVHPISSSTRAPLLVHCSAGVGRTGTFIVLDVMLQRIKDMDNVNVYAFITELRTQRVFMVQSLSQYVFIHDAIDELITCGESEIAAANIRITINRLTAFGVGGMTGFQQQFQNLQRVSPKAKDVDFKVGRSAQNVSKNRYQENVVSDLTRVRVSPAGSGCSDYINAVFVEGYRKRGAYISTQGPMEETVSDFWRMVWEYQSKCIVMLCKLEENGEESCYCYWPTQNGASAVYGKLKVTLRSQETCMDYVVRKLEVTDDKQHPGLAADGGSRFVVTQFQFSRWSPTATPATFALLEVVDKMTKVQMTSGNKAITVMCNDGVGRTGAFITVHTQLERLKTEGMVDVFQSIKSARIQRAGLVQSVEQYIFCHNALEDFLDSFETYANFKELV